MLHLAVWLTSLSVTTVRPAAARARRSRAVTMLEYVLLAAVLLAVVAVFRTGFTDAVSKLTDRITDGTNNK